MGRRKSNDWEAIAKGVGGLILLAALAGGVKGFPERLNAIVSLLVTAVLVLIGAAVLVFGHLWWWRSKRNAGPPSPTDSPNESQIASPQQLKRTKPPAQTSPPPRPAVQSTDWTARLRALDWYQFERLAAHAYRRQGYRVEQRGGAKADGGIDLIAEKNGERMAVQCKFWRAQDVGVRPVRELVGAMTDHGLASGVILTLTGFTNDARELASRQRIILMQEADVMAMLMALDLPYDRELQSLLVNPEKRCPKCDSRMELKTAQKGAYVGQKFWGCPRYPRCSFVLPLDEVPSAASWRSMTADSR